MKKVLKGLISKQWTFLVFGITMFLLSSPSVFAAAVTSITLNDANNNGIIDQAVIVFDGNVQLEDLTDDVSGATGFHVTDSANSNVAVTITSVTEAPAGTVTLTFNEGTVSSYNTSNILEVYYTDPGDATVIEYAAGNADIAISTGDGGAPAIAEVDGAKPVVVTADFSTTVSSGVTYNSLTLTYTEVLTVSTDAGGDADVVAGEAGDASTATLGAMTTAKTLAGIATWNGDSDMTVDAANKNTVVLDATGKILTIIMTSNGGWFNAGTVGPVSPTITPVSDAADIKDAAGNAVNALGTKVATTYAVTQWDVVKPTIAATTITVSDADHDGKVETATLVFPENMRDSFFTNSSATLGTTGTNTGTFASGTANDTTTVFTRTDDASVNTALGATISDFVYTGVGTKLIDQAGNLLDTDTDGTIVTADKIEVDGATPVLIGVVASKAGGKNKLAFTYSEAITLSGCTGGTISSSTCGDLTSACTFVGLGDFVTDGTITVPTTKNTLAGSGTATITVSLAGQTGGFLTSSATPPSGNIAGSPAAGVVDAASNQVATTTFAASDPLPSAEWDLTAPTAGPTNVEKGGVSAAGDYFRWTAIADPSDFGFYMTLFSTTQSDVTNKAFSNTTEWTSADDSTLATLSTAITTVTTFSAGTSYYTAMAAVDTYGNVSPISNTVTMAAGGTGPGSVKTGTTTTPTDTSTTPATTDTTTPAVDTPATDEPSTPPVDVITESGTTLTLTDISGNWAETEITAMTAQEIIKGNEDGTFKPEGNLNRAEASSILYHVLGIGDPAAVTEKPFNDVELDSWYTGYVSALKGLSLINGQSEGVFAPGASINRAEFLQLAMNIYHYLKGTTTPETQAVTDAFSDLNAKGWYAKTVSEAFDLGFIHGTACGTTTCFNPAAAITRAEATKILYDMFYTMLTAE